MNSQETHSPSPRSHVPRTRRNGDGRNPAECRNEGDKLRRSSAKKPRPLGGELHSALKVVRDDVTIGDGSVVCPFTNLYGCEIGSRTKIGPFVEVQKGARIGSNCKISSHCFICEGVTIEDNVFVGHNVTFINDLFPRATNEEGEPQTEKDWICAPTVVKRGASIGSSATLLGGISVGENAMIGAGSMVTRDVPPNAVVAGNPARILNFRGEAKKKHESSISGSQGPA